MSVGCWAVVVHGDPLPIEVVLARFSAAGHLEEWANGVGAHAVARLLDPQREPIGRGVVKITFPFR